MLDKIIPILIPILITALGSGGIVYLIIKSRYEEKLSRMNIYKDRIDGMIDRIVKGTDHVVDKITALNTVVLEIEEMVSRMKRENKWDYKEIDSKRNAFDMASMNMQNVMNQHRVYIEELIPFGGSNFYTNSFTITSKGLELMCDHSKGENVDFELAENFVNDGIANCKKGYNDIFEGVSKFKKKLFEGKSLR